MPKKAKSSKKHRIFQAVKAAMHNFMRVITFNRQKLSEISIIAGDSKKEAKSTFTALYEPEIRTVWAHQGYDNDLSLSSSFDIENSSENDTSCSTSSKSKIVSEWDEISNKGGMRSGSIIDKLNSSKADYIIPFIIQIHRPYSRPATYASLYEAVEDANVMEVRRFLKEGAKVNYKDKREFTPLQIAAYSAGNYVGEFVEQIQIIEMLLAHGADANIYKTFEEDSPLSMAAAHNSPTAVKLLLPYTAIKNFMVCTRNGKQAEYPWYTKMLVDVFSRCYSTNGIAIWDILVQHGANLNTHFDFDDTLLIATVSNFFITVSEPLDALKAALNSVKYLLQNGADPAIPSLECMEVWLRGQTALHHFLRNIPGLDQFKNEKSIVIEIIQSVIILLIKHGADINAKDNNGNTPLHLLAQVGEPDILAFLVDIGANVSAVNNEKCSPLDVARESLLTKRKFKILTAQERNDSNPYSYYPSYDKELAQIEQILIANRELKKEAQLHSLQNACLFYFFKNPVSKEAAIEDLQAMNFDDMVEKVRAFKMNGE